VRVQRITLWFVSSRWCESSVLGDGVMEKLADFFLGSSEHRDDWATARACRVMARPRMEDGAKCVLVGVDPPVIGQPFGLGDKDITSLILALRRKGSELEETVCRPVPVIIYRILRPGAGAEGVIRAPDIKLSAWGEVYPTLEAAEHAAGKSR
jgi:hypothetical protein